MIDLYAGAGLLRTRFDAASAFDRGFNDAIAKGMAKS